MGLGKQAKTLTKGQIDAMLAYLSTTRHAARNRLIFLLSVKGQGDREAELVDDQRLARRDSVRHLPL